MGAILFPRVFSKSLQRSAAFTAAAFTGGNCSPEASPKINSVFPREPLIKFRERAQESGVSEQSRCFDGPVTMEVTFQLAQYCRHNAGVPTACKAHQCLTAYFGIRFRKSLMKRYPKRGRI
jgi:hypothetical protein